MKKTDKMKPILNPAILLPIVFFLFQFFIILFLCLTALRRLKVIKIPFDGIEYSQAIFVTSIVFAVMFISLAEISALFQSFKSLQNQSVPIMQPLAAKSAQFFTVILFFELLLAGLIFMSIKIFTWLGKGFKEIETGNLPAAIILSTFTIVFSIPLKLMAEEMLQYITPHYLNFR